MIIMMTILLLYLSVHVMKFEEDVAGGRGVTDIHPLFLSIDVEM